MGGCRCTYRNCRSTSDGMLHFFHYPVFDKVRCHQWLVNARRFDFFNLKVSQLKNRVVCQHHFKDNMFMNYMKAKLIYDAVPVEDGPYCDANVKPNDPVNLAVDGDLPPLEQIETENDKMYTTHVERMANISLKYLDYLTNGELIDVDMPSNVPEEKIEPIVQESQTVQKDHTPEVETEPEEHNVVKNTYKNQRKNLVHSPKTLVQVEVEGNLEKMYREAMERNREVTKASESKVKILSEQKISSLMLVKPSGTLMNVTPSFILQKPIKQDSNTASSEVSTEKVIILNQINLSEETSDPNIPITSKPNNGTLRLTHTYPNRKPTALVKTENKTDINKTRAMQETSLNIAANTKSLLNNHNIVKTNASHRKLKSGCNTKNISPDKVAVIEQKRKFNMRLRDIVEASLSRLEERENNTLVNSKKEVGAQKQSVDEYLLGQSRVNELPNLQQYDMAAVNERIHRMECHLITKIQDNNNHIKELKTLFTKHIQKKAPGSKVHTKTQTTWSENCMKKHLFNDISKYLSPDVKNVVYEELFINNATKEINQTSRSNLKRGRSSHHKNDSEQLANSVNEIFTSDTEQNLSVNLNNSRKVSQITSVSLKESKRRKCVKH